MTVDEFKSALTGLSEAQFTRFRESWGGGRSTIDETVQEFAYAANPQQYERIIIFRLQQLGVTHLRTEDQKMVEAATESASAAKVSADASDRSARSAAESVWWARWSVVVAVVAGAAAVVAAFLTAGS